jgi:hypothetical protein
VLATGASAKEKSADKGSTDFRDSKAALRASLGHALSPVTTINRVPKGDAEITDLTVLSWEHGKSHGLPASESERPTSAEQDSEKVTLSGRALNERGGGRQDFWFLGEHTVLSGCLGLVAEALCNDADTRFQKIS